MKIYVTSGTGTGPTMLAAFDAAALMAAGINHNMIYLSSFIPPNSVVERTHYSVPPKEWGQRVYVVMSRADAQKPSEEAWAGLGWVQDESGKGMFVEHHGASEKAVTNDIHTTLEFMIKSRKENFGPIQYEITGIPCEDQPVCAMVMAIYKVERWNGN